MSKTTCHLRTRGSHADRLRLEGYDTGEETVPAAVAIAVLILALTVGYSLLDRVTVLGRPELGGSSEPNQRTQSAAW